MAGHNSFMFEWSLTEVSVFGSQLFGQASMDGCNFFAKTEREQKERNKNNDTLLILSTDFYISLFRFVQ